MLFQNPVDKDKPFVLAPHLDRINGIFSLATVEDIVKELESENSEWALQQLKTMRKMVSRQSFSSVFLGVLTGQPMMPWCRKERRSLVGDLFIIMDTWRDRERVVLKEQCSFIRVLSPCLSSAQTIFWSFVGAVS